MSVPKSSKHLSKSAGACTSFKITKNGLLLGTKEQAAEVTVYTAGIIRIQFAEKANAAAGHSYAVINAPQKTKFEVLDKGSEILLKTAALKACYRQKAPALSIL